MRYRTVNFHNGESGLIRIKFWRYSDKLGGGLTAHDENIETDCGMVAVTQSEGFAVVGAVIQVPSGVLKIDIDIETEKGEYVTELKNFPDSEPPFKCLRIESAK